MRAQVAAGTPPRSMLGAFADDYGGRYTITAERWLHGSGTGYHIVEWNVAGRYLVARNDDANPSEPGLWPRDGCNGFPFSRMRRVEDPGTADAGPGGPEGARGTR